MYNKKIIQVVEMEFLAGTDIRSACNSAVQFAKDNETTVVFEFNGVPLAARHESTPEELYCAWQTIWEEKGRAYKESPEYAEYQRKRAMEIKERQEQVDRLSSEIPNNMDDMMIWCKDFALNADDIGVVVDHQKVFEMLENAGYSENAHVGEPQENFLCRKVMGEYIIGQVMDMLKREMPPHQVIISFAEKYFNLSDKW